MPRLTSIALASFLLGLFLASARADAGNRLRDMLLDMSPSEMEAYDPGLYGDIQESSESAQPGQDPSPAHGQDHGPRKKTDDGEDAATLSPAEIGLISMATFFVFAVAGVVAKLCHVARDGFTFGVRVAEFFLRLYAWARQPRGPVIALPPA